MGIYSERDLISFLIGIYSIGFPFYGDLFYKDLFYLGQFCKDISKIF